MKNKKIIALAAGALLLGAAALFPEQAFAQISQIQDGVNDVGGSENDLTLVGAVNMIINTLLFIIGAASIIMIIYGGFRYVTSGGESSAVTSAKNTIMYAVVGLVVAIAAFAIVNYVLEIFNEDDGLPPIQGPPAPSGS